jgi:cycloartenol synthase
MVYLPMSYIYGNKSTWPVTSLVEELRTELYAEPYESIDWAVHRNNCAGLDLYVKHSWFQDFLWSALYHVDSMIPNFMRVAALRRCMEMIHYEDETTHYVNLGPVNKAMNMLCCSWEDSESDHFKKHVPRIFDYLWLAEDGMKMQGYNGSQSWDVSFAVQAMCSEGMNSLKMEPGHKDLRTILDATLTRSQQFLDASQCRFDPDDGEKFYKHISKGSWPFSTLDNGWPVSDCSAEGLRAVLDVQSANLKDITPIGLDRLEDCVNLILSYQNTREHWGDGGWATYENRRGPFWLELLNPSECFGDIVVDYDYVELTSACIVALHKFVKKYPKSNTPRIAEAISLGAASIRKHQRDDGSWYGSWGVCFTYGAWFGVNGLATVGDTYWNSINVQKAVNFLLSKQMKEGGWGESYLSSSTKIYHHADERQYVNTAWAMLAIMDAVPILYVS